MEHSNRREVSASERGHREFILLTPEELEALPDSEWLIEDILPSDGLGVLYGEPGAGKSFLALDWASHIAAGHQWFGRDVKAGDVIYVYAEGATGLKSRVRAWCNTHGVELGRIRFLPQPLNVLDKWEVAELIKVVQAHGCKPSLIIIDTLARCFGDGDENAAKDMNAFVAGTDALREAVPGTTVLVVHHSGKDANKGDRGSSALRAAADTVICFSKKGTILALKCEKQKDAEPFDVVGVRLREVTLQKGKTSCVIERGSAEPVGANSQEPKLKSDRTALDALTAFGPEGASFSDWEEASGLASSTFKDARKRLSDRGQIKQMADGRYVVTQTGPEAEMGPEQGWLKAA